LEVQSCKRLKAVVDVDTGQKETVAWGTVALLAILGMQERRINRMVVSLKVRVVDAVDIGRKGTVNWPKIALLHTLELPANLPLVDIGKRATAN